MSEPKVKVEIQPDADRRDGYEIIIDGGRAIKLTRLDVSATRPSTFGLSGKPPAFSVHRQGMVYDGPGNYPVEPGSFWAEVVLPPDQVAALRRGEKIEVEVE